jgi:electron transfer flavoprotein beta subunit
LDRSSAPAILNPYDGHALEEAVRIKERCGGKVTVISMGPPAAVEVIKKCITLGADEGYLLSDRLFAGSDTLATGYILAQGIKAIWRERSFDLVLCGKQAIDGDTAQVGSGIARRLGIPSLTYVKNVEMLDAKKGEIRVQRKTDDGYSIMATKLPCLLTVEKDINELRYASLSAMLRAIRYQPIVLGAADIGAELSRIGLAGSPTKVVKIFTPPQRNQVEILQGDDPDVVRHLITKLSQRLVARQV